jgi:predicted metalloprotease
MNPLRICVAAAALPILITGCGPKVSPSPSSTSASAAPAASTSATTGPASTSAGSTEGLDAEMVDAFDVVNTFWTNHFEDEFGGAYTAPKIFGITGLYDATTDPGCGGEKLGPDNAFYCFPSDQIAFDRGLMEHGYTIGDSWVYFVTAHEWGHAIQARLKNEYVSQMAELQADCLSGAVIYGSVADGKLEFETGDAQEIVKSLADVADDTEWGNAQDHGDPFERVNAFNYGRTNGVKGCFSQAFLGTVDNGDTTDTTPSQDPATVPTDDSGLGTGGDPVPMDDTDLGSDADTDAGNGLG